MRVTFYEFVDQHHYVESFIRELSIATSTTKITMKDGNLLNCVHKIGYLIDRVNCVDIQ